MNTRTVAALAALLSLLVLSCATAPDSRTCSDHDFPEVDLVIARQLFSGTIRVYPDGRREKLIVPHWPSGYGVDPVREPVLYKLKKRWQDVAKLHLKLLDEDPAYRERWEEAERRALEALGDREKLSEREAYQKIYPVFLEACIYQELFERLGPPEITDDPHYEGRNDPRTWGDSDDPFYFIDQAGGPSWPPSVMPFHYCAGTGGLTVSGGADEPHVRAMLWLKEHDPEFRRDWEEVLRKVAPEAEKVDPLDAEAGNRVTAFWRTLLLQGGEKSLAARIEARVREEQREREQRQQQENDPDRP